MFNICLTSTETIWLITDGETGEGDMEVGGRGRLDYNIYIFISIATLSPPE